MIMEATKQPEDLSREVEDALLNNWTTVSQVLKDSGISMYCSRCGATANGTATKHGGGCLIKKLQNKRKL